MIAPGPTLLTTFVWCCAGDFPLDLGGAGEQLLAATGGAGADPVLIRAGIAAVLLAISFGLLGTFVVVRRLSMLGDCLAHAALPGAAIAFLLVPAFGGAGIAAGALAAALFGFTIVELRPTRGRPRVSRDSALAMVLSGFFAVGVCLLSTGEASGAAVEHLLLGQLASINAGALWVLGGMSALNIAFIGCFFRQLQASSFDAAFARALDLRLVGEGLFVALVALNLVVAFKVVGLILVAALLVIPAATALLVGGRLQGALLLATALAAVGNLSGVALSYSLPKVAAGPAMVLANAAVFFLVLAFKPARAMPQKSL